MIKTKRLVGLVAIGIAGLVAVPSATVDAAAKKPAAKPKPKTTVKPKPGVAAPTTQAPAPAATPAPTAAPPAAAPAAGKSGGKIVWGLEAESSEGFLPSSSNCAISCYQVFTSMAERLLSVNDKGITSPWLADSVTSSPDFKTWTIKLKTGIKFHNGEALDAEAVKLNIDDFACGSVTLSAWFPLNGYGALCKGGKLLAGVTASGDSTVIVNTPVRWVSFPSYIASGQTYMMAPAQIKAADRNKPIGTGQFKFKEWVVGDHLTVTKNADYWGKNKPKADEIEFRPIPDENARLAQLQGGQIDFLQTSNTLSVQDMQKLEKDGKIKLDLGSPTFGEVSYIMLNNGVAPFNNKDCRLAAAYSLDVATLIKLRAPLNVPADGPFPKGSLGYQADSGYPKFNVAKGKEFFAKCKDALGGGDVKFTLGTTTVPDNIQTAAIQKQMFEDVGFKVATVNLEQQKYIGVALVGAYQAFQWRSHGGFDPDQQRIWWHNEMNPRNPATKELVYDGKTIDINLARINDGTVDTAFDQIRGNSDPAVRKKAAEAINGAMADNAYNLWLWRTVWAVASCNKCAGAAGQKTPTGEATQDFPTGLVFDMGALTKG
jgi:peptide/nickel transport system substrate-binding protein